MGTFYPVRTKHKLIQNPVCVEETSRCSSELGGRAFFFFFFFPADFISYKDRDPSVVGWAVVERLAVGNLIDLIDPRSVRLRVLARMQEFGTRVSGAREVENERDKRKL